MNYHRMLSVLELLENTVKHSDDFPILAASARVCKDWSELALNVLWRHITNLYDLFSLLAPIRKEAQETRYEFVRELSPEDWVNFDRYASRVRALFYVEYLPREGQSESFVLKQLSKTVFDTVAAKCPHPNAILPRLQSIGWNTSVHEIAVASTIFIHEKLEKFIIDIPEAAFGTSL
ncbi:hypothetical protein JAAARDRAFT_344817 [Jaapia argillacea MUCL 33604]|uniref:F-box domain-containing protein n=1 Tax=Jaapia argillacea MUCL 33604 TaxID=933084 RepID=A0A067PVB4_9AGAM|nr:hypothetical protein JAAARDRAFT_344817 [Jaapia argillacea MUCL 33604]